MNKFRSHKTVEAGVIVSLDRHMDRIAVLLESVDPLKSEGETVLAPLDLVARGTPKPGDYLVRYEDGYISWSPKKTFEEGYDAA